MSVEFANGHNKIMAWLNTGAGKGLLMADFVKEGMDKNIKVLSIMRRREIIFQTNKNYQKYYGIKSSVIMGNIGYDKNDTSFICSADTLPRRITNSKYNFLREFNLVIIDECHDATSPGYKKIIWFLEGYDLKDYDDKKFEQAKDYFKKVYIGLTATPFRVGKQCHVFWDKVVKPIESHELKERGFLVPIKVYAPKKIDVTGLRITGSDYNQKELYERVSKLQVIGDVVETYKNYGQNKAAICFCVNKAHSKIMGEAFRNAGIPAIHCDADHSKSERESAIKGLKNGTYKILTNCNIFSTGFDAPFIEILIGARPTDSEILFIQQTGRVLRPYKVCANCHTEYGGDDHCYQCGSTLTSYVKSHAILLDHANNTDRWGLPYDIRQPELEPIDSARKRAHQGIGVKTCPKCFAVVHNNERYCVCNYDFVIGSEQNSAEQIVNVAGELHEVNAEFLKEQTYQKIKQRYNTYKRLEMLRNWGPNAKFHKLHNDFGEDLFEYASEFGISVALKKKLQDNELQKGLKGFMDDVDNSAVNTKVIT